MVHIVILGYIIILLVGTWAAVTTHQMHRRFDLSFLRSLFYYVVVFNLSVFLHLVSGYVWINLVRHDPSSADPSVEGVFLLAILLVELAWAYTVVRVVVELQGAERLRVLNLLFGLVTLTFLVSYPFAWRSSDTAWSVSFVVYTCTGVIVCAWAFLAARASEADPTRRKAVRWLAYLMLFGYVPFVVSYFLPEPYPSSISAISRLWLNLVPILWLHYFFLRFFVRQSPADVGAHLEELVRRYKISKREREIMELILEGKSNKEIEGQLFISFNTVKNHIYNLYQKLGVNSRSQLMHLVMKSSNTGSNQP
jgi:DNA-binding CsgD family transcriptional regulator